MGKRSDAEDVTQYCVVCGQVLNDEETCGLTLMCSNCQFDSDAEDVECFEGYSDADA